MSHFYYLNILNYYITIVEVIAAYSNYYSSMLFFVL